MLERYQSLRHVRHYRKARWRVAFGSKQKPFLESCLGISLTSDQVQNTFNPERVADPDLVSALRDADDEIAARIFGKLGLSKINYQDIADLDAELERSAPPPGFEEIRSSETGEYHFAEAEKQTIYELRRTLLRGHDPIAYWNAGYDVGARFLASCLPSVVEDSDLGAETFTSSYRRIFAINPSDLDAPFTAELRMLATAMGLESTAPGKVLYNSLRSNNVLLIISGLELLQVHEAMVKATPFRQFIKAGLKLHKLTWGATPVLAIGTAPIELGVDAFTIKSEIEAILPVKVDERFAFFRTQWLRFLKDRDLDPAGEIGSRLKRASWHYGETRPRTVYPINLRVRAFFASNLSNHAFFDPTAGFAALAGNVSIPRDIAYFVEDVRRHIGPLRSTRDSELRMLRLLSTAKYWLTDKTLDMLSVGVPNMVSEITPKFKPTLIESLKTFANTIVDDSTSAVEPDVEAPLQAEPSYAVSIGVKAIIQDQWRHLSATPQQRRDDGEIDSDRRERAYAHWRVADHLFRNRNDRIILAQEFPFDPHWGRHSIHLISEAIRHLVRSCDGVEKGAPGLERTERFVPPKGFPQPPDYELAGCNPVGVINFCYKELFRGQLNGDTDRFGQRRRLTREHGAFALSMELLQLMSDPEDFGRPHWALKKAHHRSFLTEAGYAALNVGQFGNAKKCFESLIALESDADAIWAADAYLHLALTQLSHDRLAQAEASIQRAGALRNSFVPTSETSQKRLANLSERIERRQAQLLFLRDDHAEALQLLKKIFLDENGQLIWINKPELMASFVELLEGVKGDAETDTPLQLCVRAMFRAMSEGLQHEAMGYKLAFARLLRTRRMFDAAEAVLDEVHTDIIQHGCSERTYLAFLLEAGQTLIEDGRHVRAYSTYLVGCLERAAARALNRERYLAAHLCQVALEGAERQAMDKGEDWTTYLSEQVQQDQKYRKKDKPGKAGPFARDPLYGYSIGEAFGDERIMSLSLEGIRTALAQVKALQFNRHSAPERVSEPRKNS